MSSDDTARCQNDLLTAATLQNLLRSSLQSFTDAQPQHLFHRHSIRAPLILVLTIIVATQPALAQSAGADFCSTEMADTIRNMFNLIQFGGPLLGGVLALGAAVATPYVRRVDTKQELKSIRNQAVIWGVIVAPLATVIVGFLLNNVVVGGASCGF